MYTEHVESDTDNNLQKHISISIRLRIFFLGICIVLKRKKINRSERKEKLEAFRDDKKICKREKKNCKGKSPNEQKRNRNVMNVNFNIQ